MAAVFATAALLARNADEIPRVRTPAPGPWPQDGVMGCGIVGLPPSGLLAECTEPLHPDAPDMRGYWKTPEGSIQESIEMCGSRWIDTSKSVIHDHPVCDGTLAGGVEDYSGPDIINKDGLCTSITTAAKFEKDEAGNKCVNLYSAPFGVMMKVVSRCLQPDGTMIWVHPMAGTVIFTKVPEGEEPNCMTCPDGSIALSMEDVLSCPYQEREWVRCESGHPVGVCPRGCVPSARRLLFATIGCPADCVPA
eukprot:CAMPEP_0185360650 /NCGR_PEP_ID=MMETSP1364-20130426/9759_1 /TAXON_ID=38817 /ORGANISM="Gephyrocapsa oceanica, Strain RCC1303" /LENGTH=249 /DNA_ID=CAMNT_0027960925 /DNA_START=13 /DNA_END=762 /DNA_ORIENTATION=-